MRLSKLILAESAQRLGLPGMIGIALAALALALLLSALIPAQRELERDRAQAIQVQEHLKRVQAGLERKLETPADQLSAFYGMFPPQLAAAESLQKIYDVADKSQIQLPRGEYALAADTKAELSKYRVILPVTGSYEQIRAFIAGALEAVPTLALDDVDFQRQAVAEGQVQAKIRMTLYLARN